MFRARIQPSKNLFLLRIPVHFFASFHHLRGVFNTKSEKITFFKRNYQRFQPSFQHKKKNTCYTHRKKLALCMDFYGNFCLLFYFFQTGNYKKIEFDPQNRAIAFEIFQFGIPPTAEFSTSGARVFKMWKTFFDFLRLFLNWPAKEARKFSLQGTKTPDTGRNPASGENGSWWKPPLKGRL
jgi:hypothetical protein